MEIQSLLKTFKQWITTKTIVGVDTEFTSLDFTKSSLLAVQIGDYDTQFVFLWDLLDVSEQYEVLEVFSNPDIIKVGHNLKVDLLEIHYKYGILACNVKDTMLQHQVMTKGKNIPASYASCLEYYCDITIPKELQTSFTKLTHSSQITDEQIVYCKNDVKYLIPLYNEQIKYMHSLPVSLEGLLDLENRVLIELVEMESLGTPFSVSKLDEVIKENKEIEDRYFSLLKEEFNRLVEKYPHLKDIQYTKTTNYDNFSLNSAKQITKLLNSIHPSIKSSGTTYLQARVNLEPDFINALINYRKVQKLVSTYGEGFKKYVRDGIIRTSYKQCFTNTGRFSSGDVKVFKMGKNGLEREVKANLFCNLQNIPRDKRYRECFVSEDHYVVTCDLAQCEIRIVASMSKDKYLTEGIINKLDYHTVFATDSYRIIKNNPNYVINKQERTKHKSVLFAIFYGAAVARISEVLDVSKAIAKKIFDKLHKRIEEYFSWIDNYVNTSLYNGFALVNSVSNRILWLDEYTNSISNGMSYDKLPDLIRQLYNLPMQGTNADMMKAIIVEVGAYLRKHKLGRLLMQVHDEIVYELYDPAREPEIKDLIINTANRYLELPIYMEADSVIAKTWQK